MANKEYEVDVCETRIKTVTVRARSQEDAYSKAREWWRSNDYSLGRECVSDVHITVIGRKKERVHER